MAALREPEAALLAQFGLPISDETVELARAFADYSWASDTEGGKEAAQKLSGLRIISLLFRFLTGGEGDARKQYLILLLRAQTIKSLTEYVSSHQRTPKAELEAEVQRRLAVFAEQVKLVDEGIITWQGGSSDAAPAVNLPAAGGASGSGPAYPPPSSYGGGGVPSSSGRQTSQRKTPSSSSSAPSTSKSTAKAKPEKSSSGGPGLFDGIFGSKSEPERPRQQTAPKAAPARGADATEGSKSSKSKPSRHESTPKRVAVDPPPAQPAAVPVPRREPVVVETPIKQLHPTVLPSNDFDVEADVQALRKAMKGMGCDDKAIIAVLAFRSNGQRQEICKRFKANIGKDLAAELESELRGDMEDVALALVKTAYEYDAYLLRKAMKGVGTNESVLIELLASRSPSHLEGVSQCFQRLYGRDLLREVKSETSGDFKALLVGRLTVKRSETGEADMTQAEDDAQALFMAGEGKRGTNEAVFIDIFSTRSNAQLNAMFGEYEKISKKTMEVAISSETSGDFEKLLLAIAKCARDLQGYFAELIYLSMKGAGTNDDQLIRCIVSRCEVDMVEIKEAYQQRYGKAMKTAIEGDTSGNYKRFLLGLIAE